MGGLFNKKDKVIGPQTKIGLDMNCPNCGMYLSRNTTYFMANKHQETCKQEKEKKHLESLMKELIASKNELEELEKVQEVAKNNIKNKQPTSVKSRAVTVNNNISVSSNFNINSHKQVNNNLNKKEENIIKTNSNNNINQKKAVTGKHEKNKSQSVFKQDPNSSLLIFDPKEFAPQETNKNTARNKNKNAKKDSKFDKNMSNFNANYLKDFPFEEKVIQFKNHIQHLKIDWRESYCTLELDRDSLLKQSMAQWNKIDPYKELHINFKGEISHDAGGIIREWFTVIFKELQKESLKLFELADTADFSYKIHKDTQSTIENLDLFNFVGRIIAKALLENLTINACFNKMIYKMILDEEITLDDLVFIDKPLYHSLKELLKSERICEMGLYFVVQYNLEDKLVSDELIPDGSNILVTNNNIDEYILKRIDHIQLKDKLFINEIKSGLYSIVPEKLLKIFCSDEFELILNGQPFIDVYDWKINSIYKGFDDNSNVIQNFWNILACLSQEDLGKFLQFCTGSSRVPIGGFSALESNRGNISKFCITRVEWSKNSKNFIRAHTCFNRLDMPDFPNYSALQEAINFIINNEILGFGVD